MKKYIYIQMVYISLQQIAIFWILPAFSYFIVTNLCWHEHCDCFLYIQYIYMQVVNIFLCLESPHTELLRNLFCKLIETALDFINMFN